MNKVKKYNIRIIIPVFNDNISLNILIKKIFMIAFNKYDYFFEILIIDDNSNKEIL